MTMKKASVGIHSGLLGLTFVLSIAFFGFQSSADAQLMVGMRLEKRFYVDYEPIKAQITVSNRSGKDVVIGGPNNTSWLNFEIQAHNTILAPTSNFPKMKPYVLRRGQTIVKEVMLNRAFPMADFGSYQISANVYYPPTQKFYGSKPTKIEVTSASKLWSQGIGVSASPTSPVQQREYSLLSHRDQNKAEIYVRVRQENGMRVYATYSLGRMIAVGEPQATVDSDNQLHVLHLRDPNYYAHSVVDPNGKLVLQEIYKQVPGSRPTLMFDQSQGYVSVRGGERYDAVAAQENPDRVRNASELPPGL